MYLKIILFADGYLYSVLVNAAQLGNIVKLPHEFLRAGADRIAFSVGFESVLCVEFQPVAVKSKAALSYKHVLFGTPCPVKLV